MKAKILICFAVLLGSCTHTATTHTVHNNAPISPPAVLSATVMECLYGHGCYPITP